MPWFDAASNLQQAIQDQFKREIDEAQYKKRRKTFQEEKGLQRPERHTGLWQTGSTTHSHDIYQSMTRAVRIVLLCFTLLLLWQNAVTREWSKNSLKTNRTNLRTLKTDSVGSRQSRNGKKVTGVCEWRSPLVWTLCGLVWKTKRYRRSELRPRAATVLEQAIQERLLHETIRKEINWALYICVGQNGRGRYFSSGLLRPGPIQCKGKGKRKGKGKQKGRSSGKQERPILWENNAPLQVGQASFEYRRWGHHRESKGRNQQGKYMQKDLRIIP